MPNFHVGTKQGMYLTGVIMKLMKHAIDLKS
jgi:hypothetical protein